jgi:hypothetical protein
MTIDTYPRLRRAHIRSLHRRQAWTASAMLTGLLIAFFATPAFGKVKDLIEPPSDPVHVAAASGTAQQLLSLPLRLQAGKTFVLWTGPSKTGGTCEFADVTSAPTAAPTANAGGICDMGAQPESLPIGPIVRWIAIGNGQFDVIIQGHLADATGIARVQLRTGAGTLTELPVHAGYFLAELPQASSAIGQLPNGGPYTLTGLDSTGAVMSQLDLQQFLTKAQPPK